MPAPFAGDDSHATTSDPLPRHHHKPGLLARFTMLGMFLIATVALVFGVLTVLKLPVVNDPSRIDTPPRLKSPDEGQGKPEPSPTKPKGKPEPSSLPTPVPEQPTLVEPAPDLPDGVESKSPGMEALGVLEKFLTAKSLEERLDQIETKTPPGELAMSCLAGPLPPAPKMLLEIQESNPVEEVVDFYYSVDFETKDHRTNPQTILVRTRGRSGPKVVVDPFLDLFGGRLAAYASGPKDKAGVFQVIASALATCTDAAMPNRDKKLTLKLLAKDNTKAIAEAHFGKMSKIGEMLEDGTYSLSYAKATPCTLMLRWNTEDDVNHPYLEAIAIKTLDWNP